MSNGLGLRLIAEGVYQTDVEDGPETIEYLGGVYHRFMDVFYVDRPLDELENSQRTSLCRARQNHPDIINLSVANNTVRDMFGTFVRNLSPSTLLEMGSGVTPAIFFPPQGMHLVLADADPEVILQNKTLGRESVLFGGDQALPYEDDYFEIAIAAFVFHFRVDDSQIAELRRCLGRDGIMIANVYKRTKESKARLQMQFQAERFVVLRESDPFELCRSNEFWVLGCNARRVQTIMKALKTFLTTYSLRQ